jgi:hypothetical protein
LLSLFIYYYLSLLRFNHISDTPPETKTQLKILNAGKTLRAF